MSESTLKDVAKLAGVHPGTASRALNPETKKMVSSTTVERVVAAAKKLGYHPNPLARALKTNRSNTIGMLIPDLTNPLFPPVVRGVEEVLEPVGYTALLANTDNLPERAAEIYSRIQARQVDGFLIGTAYRKDPLVSAAARQGTPVVLINRTVDGLNLPLVIGDDRSGIAQAISHLAEFGHRNIAYISGPTITSTGNLRKGAFRSTLYESGLPFAEKHVVDAEAFTARAGFAAAGKLMGVSDRFTAIVCGNDLIALGVLDAIEAHGFRCPEDFSIVGFNDMPFTDRFRPPLTTVHISQHDTGAEAARLLLRRLEAPAAPVTTVTLPAQLIIRGSTGPAKND